MKERRDAESCGARNGLTLIFGRIIKLKNRLTLIFGRIIKLKNGLTLISGRRLADTTTQCVHNAFLMCPESCDARNGVKMSQNYS